MPHRPSPAADAPQDRGAPPLRIGLIGAGIARSRFATAMGLLADRHGLALEFTPVDTAGRAGFVFASFVERLVTQGWTGVSVTHPHKTEAAAWAGAAMRPEVRALGAANTLVFRPALAGHNTDYLGFLGAWAAIMGDHPPGRVAVAGAGGVARAVAPALLRLGASEVAVWDADPARAAALARDVPGLRALTLPEVPEAVRAADGLVNATPLGMHGHPGSAVDPALIGPQAWAFDAVYTPTDTAFLTCAAAAGLTVLTGFDLFRHMALASFAAYTGIAPDPAEALPLLAPLCPKEAA